MCPCTCRAGASGRLAPLCPPQCSLPNYIHNCVSLWQAVTWLTWQRAGKGCSNVSKLPGMEIVALLNLFLHRLGCAFAESSPQRGRAASACLPSHGMAWGTQQGCALLPLRWSLSFWQSILLLAAGLIQTLADISASS